MPDPPQPHDPSGIPEEPEETGGGRPDEPAGGAAFSLDPTGRHSASADGWTLPQSYPATLVAMWPGDDAPTRTEIMASLRGAYGEGVEVVDELESQTNDILWNAVIQVPAIASRIIVWAEAAKPISETGLDDPALAACRWVVGAELVLANEAPLRDFASAIRLLAGLADDIPAVFDANTGQWHLRPSLELSFLAPNAEPPDEVLWVIHAVTGGDRLGSETVWLYTAGLWRCGRPELEILEVPRKHVESAVAVINAVAGIALEEPLPDAGRPFEIGNELSVVLQPWREVVRYLDESAHGSLADRGLEPEAGEEEAPPDNPLCGVRAVICGPQAVGAYRPIWTWPREAIERIEGDDGTLYQTRSATRRQQRLAQRMLPDFAVAIASLLHDGVDLESDAAPGFFAKVGFRAGDGEDPDHEHLWFRLVQLDGPRMEGRLLNPPQLLGGMAPGDLRWFDQDQVSWWHVAVGDTGFGPESTGAMTEAVDAYRREHGGPE